jgi:hypothetical protein
MEIMKKIEKATLVIFAGLMLLFSRTAIGLSVDSINDIYNAVTITGQTSQVDSGPTLEPNMEKGESPGSDGTRPDVSKEIPATKDYIRAFPNDLVGGTKRIFHSDNLPLALIGSSLTIAALAIDNKAKRESLEDHPLGNLRNFGNTIGAGYIEVGAGVGMFLAGQGFNDTKLADTGMATLEALLIDGIATQGLKYTVGRRRPNNQGDKMSFPSGHVSVTATFAASVSEMYDWDLRLAIPLYATVAVVGIARMDSNMHYLSDVLAGATLGTLVGRSFAKYHKEKTAEQKVTFLPVYKKDFKGVLFSYHF